MDSIKDLTAGQIEEHINEQVTARYDEKET